MWHCCCTKKEAVKCHNYNNNYSNNNNNNNNNNWNDLKTGHNACHVMTIAATIIIAMYKEEKVNIEMTGLFHLILEENRQDATFKKKKVAVVLNGKSVYQHPNDVIQGEPGESSMQKRTLTPRLEWVYIYTPVYNLQV